MNLYESMSKTMTDQTDIKEYWCWQNKRDSGISHETCQKIINLGEKNWGKGFGKEASKKVINYCFKKLKLRKINLGVISHHKDAILLYKSLGFIQEGRFKNHVFFQNRFVDYLWMAIFNKQ